VSFRARRGICSREYRREDGGNGQKIPRWRAV
jgi:hypothetical protein